MDSKKFVGVPTICQVLRDIYHSTDRNDIRLKCRVAVAMARAMHEKLKKYKQGINDGTNRSKNLRSMS